MANTTKLTLPLVAPAQAQKHVPVNESLLKLDTIVQLSVKDRDRTSPPGSPSDGDVYIPASGSTGAWAGWDMNIAVLSDGNWVKLPPRLGWRCWVEDEGGLFVYNGTHWVLVSSGGGDGRERLNADRTYHVRMDGSDGNSGLQNSAAGAFATVGRAVEAAYGSIDLGPFNVTIQLGNGTYSESIYVPAPHIGAGTITIAGNEASPQNTILAGAPGLRTIELANAASLRVRDFELRGNGNAATHVSKSAILSVGSGMRFGVATTAHLYAQDNGVIDALNATYSIVGSAGRHLLAVTGSVVNTLNCNVTLVGAPAFSTAYAQANRTSVINANGCTFVNSATGKRFDIATNGVVYANAGADFLPGTVAGTTASGGQYA